MLRADIEFLRSSVVPDGFEGTVYDVGGGEFEHHSGNLRYRENGVPPLVVRAPLERYGAVLLHEEDARAIDEELVRPRLRRSSPSTRR